MSDLLSGIQWSSTICADSLTRYINQLHGGLPAHYAQQSISCAVRAVSEHPQWAVETVKSLDTPALLDRRSCPPFSAILDEASCLAIAASFTRGLKLFLSSTSTERDPAINSLASAMRRWPSHVVITRQEADGNESRLAMKVGAAPFLKPGRDVRRPEGICLGFKRQRLRSRD